MNRQGLRLRPVIDRYPTVEEALTGCGRWERLLPQWFNRMNLQAHHSTISNLASRCKALPAELQTAGGFLLGTNDIGQDVWSRMLWGTRIALIIGFSSSIISLLIGVPLGLMAGLHRGII